MQIDITTLILSCVSAIVGAIVAWLILRKGFSESARETANLHERTHVLETENSELDKHLAVAEQKNARIPELEDRLAAREESLESLREENATGKATIAELNVRIEDEKKLSEEKLNTINDAREDLRNQFKTLSQEIFDEKGKRL